MIQPTKDNAEYLEYEKHIRESFDRTKGIVVAANKNIWELTNANNLLSNRVASLREEVNILKLLLEQNK